LRIRQYI